MSSTHPTIALYSRWNDGHRQPYVNLVGRLWAAASKPLEALPLHRGPVLFLMIEEAFGAFVAVALLRALLGRRTVGLLFRPAPALSDASPRLRFKRLVLRGLKRVGPCRVLTILPFSIDARYATIADDHIYDFQLWDIDAAIAARAADADGNASELAARIGGQRLGRRVVCAVGGQNVDKGFDLLARIYVEQPALREAYLFVSGGRVDAGSQVAARALSAAGGIVIDRFVTDEELWSLYASADLVWCRYSEAYDQASGIFGRAVQLGITPVLRSGSQLERFCRAEAIDYLTEDMLSAAAKEPASTSQDRRRRSLVGTFRSVSLRNLSEALGVSPIAHPGGPASG